MNEQKKKAVTQRKLTLNRETLRVIDSQDSKLLDEVVGGLAPAPTEDTLCDQTVCGGCSWTRG